MTLHTKNRLTDGYQHDILQLGENPLAIDIERRTTMPYLLVRHKITDYQHWKSAFDQHGATRKASGSKRGVLLRNIQDPNELVIIVEFEDLSQARQFAHSDDLQKKMREAGVIDQPNIYFLEEIEDIPV